jgi:hypothetical protein
MLVIQDREPSLDPLANGIFVNAKQTGDLFDRVVAVNFHLAVVGAEGGGPELVWLITQFGTQHGYDKRSFL